MPGADRMVKEERRPEAKEQDIIPIITSKYRTWVELVDNKDKD